MIISDLEHLEIVRETKELEGGAAIFGFDLKFLALGGKNSLSQVTKSNFLATSTNGVNISSGEFQLVLGAE
jgi:hypothetical protein